MLNTASYKLEFTLVLLLPSYSDYKLPDLGDFLNLSKQDLVVYLQPDHASPY